MEIVPLDKVLYMHMSLFSQVYKRVHTLGGGDKRATDWHPFQGVVILCDASCKRKRKRTLPTWFTGSIKMTLPYFYNVMLTLPSTRVKEMNYNAI